MNERFYLLKIRLLDIEPEIWRRFVVPASIITLDRLHDVIQIVMGWTDSHLYEFTISKNRYNYRPQSSVDGLEASCYRLVNLIKQKGRTFHYLYDFGDAWEHELTIEDSNYSIDPEMGAEITCLDGERACPPEDVGGVPGYYDFCEALKDPKHEEHESLIEWSGGDYDSEKYDVNAVNAELVKYMRWSRDRCKRWGEIE